MARHIFIFQTFWYQFAFIQGKVGAAWAYNQELCMNRMPQATPPTALALADWSILFLSAQQFKGAKNKKKGALYSVLIKNRQNNSVRNPPGTAQYDFGHDPSHPATTFSHDL